MKKPVALTLISLTLALSACSAQQDASNHTTNTPSATATATASATPTAPITVEPSKDAEHPERAQGNDYATGMIGTEEQTPGTITTVAPDTTASPTSNVVVPNPDHNAVASDADKQKLTDMLNALEGSPVISGKNVVAQPLREYKIKPGDSKEQNGELSANKYAEIVILDDVSEGGEEYAIVSPQIKGNEADIRANGLRPVSLNTAREAIKNDYNTRIQGFLHYEPNATYTGETILVLHVKQANHGAYVKGGATAVGSAPTPTNTPQ